MDLNKLFAFLLLGNFLMLSATNGKTSLWKPQFYTWRRPYVHRWATDYPRQAGVGGGVKNYVYDQRLKSETWIQNPAVPPATQALHGVLITNSQGLVRLDQLALATHATQEKALALAIATPIATAAAATAIAAQARFIWWVAGGGLHRCTFPLARQLSAGCAPELITTTQTTPTSTPTSTTTPATTTLTSMTPTIRTTALASPTRTTTSTSIVPTTRTTPAPSTPITFCTDAESITSSLTSGKFTVDGGRCHDCQLTVEAPVGTRIKLSCTITKLLGIGMSAYLRVTDGVGATVDFTATNANTSFVYTTTDNKCVVNLKKNAHSMYTCTWTTAYADGHHHNRLIAQITDYEDMLLT